jgi:hypothetical protein
MSADDRAGDTFTPTPEKTDEHTATDSKNASGDSGQEGPDATEEYASQTTYAERLECTARRRGRMRDLDHHASWREVYRQCEVVAPDASGYFHGGDP